MWLIYANTIRLNTAMLNNSFSFTGDAFEGIF